jgi:DNA transformation protein
MFALLWEDRIFLKTSAQTKPQFEAVGSTPFIFQPKSGPAMTMSYYRMPDAAYDDPDALKEWASLGLQAALAGKVRKSTKKTPRKPILSAKDLQDLPLKTKVKGPKTTRHRTR